jgi:ATP-dependent Lhr-like helicase
MEALAGRGALFQSDLVDLTGRQPAEIEDALWDGVARGLLTADGFRAVRSLFTRRALDAVSGRKRLRRGGRLAVGGLGGVRLTAHTGGRWSVLLPPLDECDPDELAEAVAEQLVVRWGVVFRDLLARESLAVPWREVLWALRRMEARGTVRGGRFVNGFSGEQFAHPDAVEALRAVRKTPRSGETIRLSAADPLNLTDIVLPGPRVPAVAANTLTYVDGAVPDDGEVLGDAAAAGTGPVLTA